MTRILSCCLLLSVFTFGCAMPTNAENTVQKLYRAVNPGVVELHVKALASPKAGQVTYQATTTGSLGSGAIISKEGRILTAAHVVDKATEIEVLFSDGSKTSGHVVWVDSLIDLAMIQAAKMPENPTVLSLAPANTVEIGEQVIVIGAPYGVSHSLSVGYLSGIRDQEKIPGNNIVPRYLQSDAAINKGNSGGPMFNSQGEIIGIVSHILSQSGGSQGLGFAVSIDTIHEIIASKPMNFSGFIPIMLTPPLAHALNIAQGYGMLIQQVIPGTLADKLNFKGGNINVMLGPIPVLLGGDIILSIDGQPMKDISSIVVLKERLAKYKTGDTINFTFLRQGTLQSIQWIVE